MRKIDRNLLPDGKNRRFYLCDQTEDFFGLPRRKLPYWRGGLSHRRAMPHGALARAPRPSARRDSGLSDISRSSPTKAVRTDRARGPAEQVCEMDAYDPSIKFPVSSKEFLVRPPKIPCFVA
jgi:hypothetical protein